MRGRIKELADVELDPRRPWVDMEARTGISGRRWQNVVQGRQRASDDMLEALGRVWPQYAYWLMTGKTDEANGHTSPTLARIARDLETLRKAG